MAGGSSGPLQARWAAAACLALAAWTSLGTVAVTDPASARSRLGLLPPTWLLVPLLAATFLGLGRLRPAERWPAFLSGLLLLPWLPFPVPAAAVLWTGPLASWVWVGVVVGFVAAATPGRLRVAVLADPRRAPLVAALLGVALYATGAWAISAAAPTGDEPHYLILTRSLLEDGDLRIENNYAQGDLLELLPADLRPHFQRRGRDGEVYSIHSPGLPALLLPAFALLGQRGAVLFLGCLSALGGALLWRVAYQVTGDPGAAWFGWACAALSAPSFYAGLTIFPDAPGAVLALAGVALLASHETGSACAGQRPGPVSLGLTGLALAALPWLHTRFAVLAGGLGACAVLRLLGAQGAGPRIAAFLAAPLVSAVLWFGYFQWIYGSPSPAAPYVQETFNPAHALRGLPGLFLDRQFGLLPYAPVLALACGGFRVLWRGRRRFATELLAVSGLYLLLVSCFGMWWGGASPPARLTVPVVPWLALAAAALWARPGGPSTRAWGGLLVTVSLLVTLSLGGYRGGELLRNDRDSSRLLAFVSDAVDLNSALPSFLGQTAGEVAWRTAAWTVALGLAAWWLRRSLFSRGALGLATAGAFAGAVMTAFALVSPLPLETTRAQLRLLQAYDPARRPLGLLYDPLGLDTPERVVERVRLDLNERRPLIEDVPAGSYGLELGPAAAGALVGVEVGRSLRPLATLRLGTSGEGRFDLAVSATRLGIALDGPGPHGGGPIRVRPLALLPPRERPTTRPALGAAGYEAASVYALDDGVTLERTGFWLSAEAGSEILIRPASKGAPVSLLVRNVPAPNVVLLETEGWRRRLELTAGEEVVVPLPPPRGPLRLHASAVFSPATAGAAGRPRGRRGGRRLGAWFAVR